MDSILSLFSSYTSSELTYKKLGQLIRQIDINSINFSNEPEAYEKSDVSDYYRKIYTLDPLEVAVLYWPPSAESAIHFHSGFYGYVLVLNGEGENVEFQFQDKILTPKRRILCKKSGVMNEPDGTIHLIKNASSENPLITLHLYVPALENLDGLTLFDIESKKIGVLNEKALNASFNEPIAHFHSIEDNAFETVDPTQNPKSHRSHYIFPVVPKPNEEEINVMLQAYYDEQAAKYDKFDTEHASRQAYNNAINEQIAADFQDFKPKNVLDIAGGTGRRSEEIKNMCQGNFQPVILDMSANMIVEAQKRGFTGINAPFLSAKLPKDHFDAIYFLYAFGHISSNALRIQTLEKIYSQLKSGGRFYFDVFDIDNKHEWGHMARKNYFDLELEHMGYEEGDVFYKKSGGSEVAYLHYFDREKLIKMIEKIGFNVRKVSQIGYVKNAGAYCTKPNEGNLFLILEKPKK